jgi:hypothetical protein
MKLHIEAVNGCTHSCQGCQSHKGQLKFMLPSVFATAIDKFKPARVAIYGLGETFLHPRLRELLSVRDLMGCDSVIKTNGDGDCNQYISALGFVKRILFDIDSVSNEVHRMSRSTDVEIVKRNLLQCREQSDGTGTQVGIYQLVHAENWRDSLVLYEFAKKYDVLFEGVPYLPIEIGTEHPMPAHTHLSMSSEQVRQFAEVWKNKACEVTWYRWDIDITHDEGVFISWDGQLRKCLGRQISLNQSVYDESIDVPVKRCSDCGINELICSLSSSAVSMGCQSISIPPRIKYDSTMKKHSETELIDCALDPYS